MRSFLKVITILLMAAFLAISCEPQDKKDDSSQPQSNDPASQRLLNASLPRFSEKVLDGYQDCSELKGDLESAAKLFVNGVIQENKRYGGYYYGEDDTAIPTAIPDSEPGAPQDGDNGAKGGAEGYQTNNQVAGVDEADLAKSDGTFIYSVYGNSLVVNDLDGNLLSKKTAFEDRGIASLLLSNNRILAISYPWVDYSYDFVVEDGKEAKITQTTLLALYSVEQDGGLSLIKEQEIDGRFLQGRRVETKAHLLTSSNLGIYEYLSYPLSRYNEEFYDLSSDAYEEKAYQKAETIIPAWSEKLMTELFETNKQCQNIIRLSRMVETTEEDGNLLRQNEAVLGSFAMISTLDFTDDTLKIRKAGAFTPQAYDYGMNFYAGPDAMVLSSNGMKMIAENDWEAATYLTTFSIDNGKVTPEAVGKVRGTLLNQFSLDIFDGYLRVATTTQKIWMPSSEPFNVDVAVSDEPAPPPVGVGGTGGNQSESFVTIFKTDGRKLKKTGQVGGMGLDERIYSVRFFGEKGFVVTFRQVDPFYTLDLSDPTDPKKVGELKIPGYSSYLHPISEDRILAIGVEVDPQTQWTQGLKISLFDVSDFANPSELQKFVAEVSSYSDALWDHKAFRYLREEEKLIIPMTIYSWYDSTNDFDGFQIFDVSDDAIGLYGKISHFDQNNRYDYYDCYYASYLTPRSMVFDGQLVTMKGHTIQSTDLDSLDQQWSLSLLDEASSDKCDYGYGYYARD